MALSKILMTRINNNHCIFTFTRWVHAIAQPPPLTTAISQSTLTTPMVLPEFERSTYTNHNNINIGSGFCIGPESMDLMAVPKKKTSPHKRGIRNGLKALKPIPVIIRCKVWGRVKLPHFFCCSGLREGDGQNGSIS